MSVYVNILTTNLCIPGVGFRLNLPTDSGLRPVTSLTPPTSKTKSGGRSIAHRQPRHSTPITEESPEIVQGDTPTGGGNNAQKQQPTLTLEEGMESQAQESSDLPRFHLESKDRLSCCIVFFFVDMCQNHRNLSLAKPRLKMIMYTLSSTIKSLTLNIH